MARSRPALASSLDHSRRNIAAYREALANDRRLLERAGYARSWYADRAPDGSWLFAPSKFVGYDYATADAYLADSGASGDRDGRETERLLSRWYAVARPSSALGRELHDQLRAWLASLGQRANAAARISVPPDLLPGEQSYAGSPTQEADLLARISIDPTVCGGRPCIRGTRIRVADILAMLSHGASQDEILRDYDHLAGDDLLATLAYAARATDHRVIRAA